ncbi:MAG: DNA-binding protein [Candidatus Omnitrophica bacterium]|nr:DNA-binding protein [Candidatus Omnitrophota bacterium]
MKKFFILYFLISLFLFSENFVDIKDLYQQSKRYDNKIVKIRGEAIGEKIKRGMEICINIKDENEDYVIGVVLNKEMAEKIENLGRYRVKGDIVEIKGIYYENCPYHLGERDIHVMEIEVLLKGEKHPEEIGIHKIILSFFLVLCVIFVIYYYHKVSPVK